MIHWFIALRYASWKRTSRVTREDVGTEDGPVRSLIFSYWLKKLELPAVLGAQSDAEDSSRKSLVLLTFVSPTLRLWKRKKHPPPCLRALLPHSALLPPQSPWTDLVLSPPKAGVYSNSCAHFCNRERQSPVFPSLPPLLRTGSIAPPPGLGLSDSPPRSHSDRCRWTEPLPAAGSPLLPRTFFLLLFTAALPLSAPPLFLPCLQPTK